VSICALFVCGRMGCSRHSVVLAKDKRKEGNYGTVGVVSDMGVAGVGVVSDVKLAGSC